MALTNFIENALVDHLLRGVPYTAPATVYVGLFTATPSDSGGGTEVAGGSYARASIACSLANFSGTQGAGTTAASSGTSGATSNNISIAFPTPSANWGTVTHFALFDAPTGGNMLAYAALSITRTVNNGDLAPSFPVANLSFGLD